MHPEARDGLDRMIAATGIDRGAGWRVLDLGGRDVNGGIRDLLPDAHWTGLDIRSGPGVDLVHDATLPWPDGFPLFDIVVSTEMLEHVHDWPAVLETAHAALDPFGAQLAFFTCASTGRRPHGASGEWDPPADEWYGNVDPEHLSRELGRVFADSIVEYNPTPGDAYAYASAVKW